jgi:DNA mismatch endonuclease, patch repair protein
MRQLGVRKVGNRRAKARTTAHVPDETRSRIMRSVKREKTKPEIAVARYLSARGIRFRTNVRSLPGSPDLANKSRRFAIYVHGCFWHRHEGCRRATTPKDNATFWREKFEQNVARDRRKERALRSLGYEVVTVWECETVSEDRLAEALRPILRHVTPTGTP